MTVQPNMALPLRSAAAHYAPTPTNLNQSSGTQNNYNQSGGYNNKQFNANMITYVEASKPPRTPLQPNCILPFHRNRDFVEIPELQTLGEKLSHPTARVALVGIGGVGKSQLAIEYCYRRQETSPETWILWIHASTSSRFDESIYNLADDVQIEGRDDPQVNIYQLFYNWLQEKRKGGWLIVIDNADDADFLFEAPNVNARHRASERPHSTTKRRIDYIPASNTNGSLILTTRIRKTASRIVDDCDMVLINPLRGTSGMMLLEKKLGEQKDKTLARELISALDYIPLAIAQAAAYIKKRAPKCSVQQYLAEFNKNERSRTRILNTSFEELRLDSQASTSVIVTWQMSFDHIRQIRPSAANLLSLMSFYNHQGIPETLLQGLYQPSNHCADAEKLKRTDYDSDSSSISGTDETFDDDIFLLRDFLFVSPNIDGSNFEMHRLVQLAVRKWLETQGQYEQWAAQSIRCLDLSLPSYEYESWANFRPFYPHVHLALGRKLVDRDVRLAWTSVLTKGGLFALRQGFLMEAEQFLMKALKTKKALLGEDHRATLVAMVEVAAVMQARGKFNDAEELMKVIIEREEQILGTEHSETLKSMSRRAELLQQQGDSESAERLARQTLRGMEKVFNHDHQEALTCACNLAAILTSRKKFDEAEAMTLQILMRRESKFGKTHPDTLTTMNNLAVLLCGQQKYEEAEKVIHRTLEGREQILGKTHPETLTSANNLAMVLQIEGKCVEGEKLNIRILKERQELLGKDHPETLTSMNNLGLALLYQGKYDQAEEQIRQALEGGRRTIGEDHPVTIQSRENLERVHWAQRNKSQEIVWKMS